MIFWTGSARRVIEERHRRAMTVAFPLPTGETAILQRLLSGL